MKSSEPQELGRLVDPPMMQTLSSAVAPMIVALTGTLYVSGYAYREALLKDFGLSAAAVEISLQDNLARGYLAILPALVAIPIGLGADRVIQRFFHRSIKKISPEGYEEAQSFIVRTGIRKATYWMNWALAVAVSLFMGFGSGTFVAELTLRKLKQAVSDGCRECYTYSFGNEAISGRLIIQDAQRMMILTQNGLRIEETSELTKTAPYIRPKIQPQPRSKVRQRVTRP